VGPFAQWSRPRICLLILAWALIPAARLRAADRQAVDRAVSAMEGLVGPGLQVNRSLAAGTVTFLAAPEGKALPAAGGPTAPRHDRALSFVWEYAGAFGLGKLSGLEVTRAVGLDPQGFEHVRLQQTHRGIPVTGAELTVHLRDVGVVSVLAKTVPDLESLDVVPGIEPDLAAQTARDGVAKGLAAGTLRATTPRLEVLNRGLLEGGLGPSRLAWFVEVTGEELRDFVWIDAQRGVTLLRFSQLPEARNRQVFTAKSGPGLPGDLLRSEGQPASSDADADAAYDSAGDAYDYFKGQHARDSYDDAGAPLVSTVHFCPTGVPCPYPNAAWTGTQMVYGEGFSQADDVAAHELTHAVVEHTANLFYYMQSGALNESFADMFGETIDLTNGRGNDDPSARWLVGEDIPGFGAVRHMMNPGQFGHPARAGLGTMVCSNADNGGVHSNSGVPNHAFALMVDGGQYETTNVTGIGLVKAGKVMYRTLTHYLTSASNLVDFAHAARRACYDLVGSDGFTNADCAEVTAALQAVRMEDEFCQGMSRGPIQYACDFHQEPWTLFEDNLENLNSGNWTTGFSLGGNHWTEGAGVPDIYFTGYASSGRWSFWGFGASAPGESWVAMTRGIVLPPKSYVYFRHSFGLEGSYDGGRPEFSTDGGATWQLLLSRSGGPSYVQLRQGTGNPLGGQLAFSGLSYGYLNDMASLAAYQGSEFRIRFRIGTDFIGSDIGWFIDDVKIYTCLDRVAVSIADAHVVEGDTGTAAAAFTASLGANPDGVTVSFEYEAVSGTTDIPATPGIDFIPTAGRVTFPPGVTSRTITVPVLGDRLAEADEQLQLQLRNGQFAGWDPVPAAAIIQNDDAPGFTISDVTVVEPVGGTVNATFEVALTPPGASATVGYQTVDGTATAPGDYTATAGTLSFDTVNDRRLVTVPVKASPSILSPRTFHLDLSASSGPPIARGRAVGSIFERGLHVVTPCRVLDTRQPENAPSLASGFPRTLTIGNTCGLPPTAKAVALNLTVVQPTASGHLTVWPSGAAQPSTSTINFGGGQTRANSAVVPLGPDGRFSAIAAVPGGDVDLIVDVTGFFE
jgi:Zn-dependent metalloprotease